IEGEPTVSDAVAAGADIITFSGDKLLGGPQAGLIVGKKKYLDMIANNPLARAIRIDKLTLAGLEATLREYLDEEKAIKNIPTLNMLCQPLSEIEKKAVYIADRLKAVNNKFEVSVVDETSQSGGGALPLVSLQTKVVAILSKNLSAARLEELLRKNNPPIICRIKEGRILLDPRTIQRDELDTVINSIKGIASRL
ncbi:MAG: L-seryl-tRNA(Sec) selenium transferase, partial [Nitrospirae bacterium]|nr:L-seryl-tRNA(Sec) selenium transferase [Nitrospirota bacterium]